MGGVGQVGYGPLWRIDGPLPQPPVYSLLKAARVVDDADTEGVERWGNGVEVYPYPSDSAGVWDACPTGSNAVNKVDGNVLPKPKFGAMVVYLAETCSSFGIFGSGLSNDEAQNRFVARAAAAFAAVESASIEKEFAAGAVLGNNPHLADGNGTFPWGTAVTSVTNGFALLEDQIAASGKQGFIHCPPSTATFAKSLRLIDDDKGTLRTANGTTVVPGAGYAQANSHPAGSPAATGTQEWIYATGPVEIRRSELIVMPDQLWMALDRTKNALTYRVERYYVVDWDTEVQASVLIDRCTTACGSPSS